MRSTSCSARSSRGSHPRPGPAGRHVRLYFATQASVRPPTFFVSTNHATDIGHSYRRFLVNQFRKAYGFEGTPVRLVFRAHAQKKRGGSAAAVAVKKGKRARAVAVNENGFVPRFNGSDSRSAGSNR